MTITGVAPGTSSDGRTEGTAVEGDDSQRGEEVDRDPGASDAERAAFAPQGPLTGPLEGHARQRLESTGFFPKGDQLPGIAIDNTRLHRAALTLVEAERASVRKEGGYLPPSATAQACATLRIAGPTG